jgi:hypothetical protein
MRFVQTPVFVAVAFLLIAAALTSCGSSSNADAGRVLLSISVSPQTADALNFPNGQVVFTATGTFSKAPLTGPVSFTSPYQGSFFVANPSTQVVANVVATGDGTVTVQCTSGVTDTVQVVASAAANNGTSAVVTGAGSLTCP